MSSDKIDLILFCPENYPGVTAILRHLKGTLDSELNVLLTHSFSDIRNDTPTILGGYDSMYNGLMELIEAPVAVYWCSTIGQMEQALIELPRFVELLKYKPTIFTPHYPFADTFHKLGLQNVKHLPPTICDEWLNKEPIPMKSAKDFKIDLMVPMHHRKNILNQILAGVSVGTVHTHPLPDVYAWLKQFKIIEHNWMDAEAYEEHLKKMHCAMQITWTESFNYALAERALLGIPTLMSFQNACNHDLGNVPEMFMLQNADNATEIRCMLQNIKSNYHDAINQWNQYRYALINFYKRNNKEAVQVIKKWIGGKKCA